MRRKISVLLVLVFILAGCGGGNMPSIEKDWQSLSPEKKCIFVLDWYTGAFKAHEAYIITTLGSNGLILSTIS